jgi:hypothetical protein
MDMVRLTRQHWDWESLRPFFALDPPAQRACLKRQKAQRRILIKVLLEVQPELLHVIIIIPGPSIDDNMNFKTESSWCTGIQAEDPKADPYLSTIPHG